jgi:hypothetical protein
MSDFGGEYKSLKFDKLVKDLGIEIRASTPRTPQQNGRAERLNRTIMDKAEAMRHYASLPSSWWEFSVSHAVYVYNRTPVRRLKWQTPYKLLTGVTPDIGNLQVLGCLSWVWIHPDNRKDKLSPKAAPMIFLGYPKGVKGYLFMRIGSNSEYIGTKAIFDERLFPKSEGSKLPKITPVHRLDGEPSLTTDSYSSKEEDQLRRNRRGPSIAPNEVIASDSDSDESSDSDDQPEAPPENPRKDRTITRSGRQVKVPTRKDNVYGETKAPMDIVREIAGVRSWGKRV